MKLIALIAAVVLAGPSMGEARERHGTFTYNSMERGPNLAFFVKERSLPNSYSRTKTDPFTGEATGPVHRFEIRTGECGNQRDRGDCSYNAVRSELSENNHRGTRFGRIQPKQAWYEFDVGFPKGFPFGPRQTSGYYLFGQWIGNDCPHVNFGNRSSRDGYILHIRTNQIIPGHKHGECQPADMIPVIDMRELEGRWAHFVVFIRWSTGKDGEIKVFIDGEQKVQYNGRTLVPENTGRNHFDFGVYLALAKDLNHVKPATLYYRDIRRLRRQPPM